MARQALREGQALRPQASSSAPWVQNRLKQFVFKEMASFSTSPWAESTSQGRECQLQGDVAGGSRDRREDSGGARQSGLGVGTWVLPCGLGQEPWVKGALQGAGLAL